MPVFVTKDDVLPEIMKTDALAAGIDASMRSLATTKIPAATFAQWVSFLYGYTQWSTAAKSDLGGFFSFGVDAPELGDQAIAYENQLNAWQAQLNTLAGTQIAPVGTTPVAIAAQNAASLPTPTSAGFGGIGTGVVIGALGIAVLLAVVGRR